MDKQAIYSNLPVYRDCYAVMLEFTKMRGALPRDVRYTLAQDLHKVVMEMLVTIYRANSARADKARLIAELRRKAVELQIYFRLLSDLRLLGVDKAAFFMDKVASIGKQLTAWHKSAMRESADISKGAEPPPYAGGRPEWGGSRSAPASHKANPMSERAAHMASPAKKGDLAANSGATPWR